MKKNLHMENLNKGFEKSSIDFLMKSIVDFSSNYSYGISRAFLFLFWGWKVPEALHGRFLFQAW